MFDETMARMGRGETTALKETEVSSANQYLLKKSWEYFRDRIKTIEEHWSQILEAKQKQIQAMEEELNQSHAIQEDLERENKSFQVFENAVKETRKDDF